MKPVIGVPLRYTRTNDERPILYIGEKVRRTLQKAGGAVQRRRSALPQPKDPLRIPPATLFRKKVFPKIREKPKRPKEGRGSSCPLHLPPP